MYQPKTDLPVLTRCVFLAAFFAVLASGLGRCRGQADASEPEELVLARMVISEAGYHPGRETFAILHVLEWRRTHLPALQGLSLVAMGRAYCSGWGGRRNTSNPHVRRAQGLAANQIPQSLIEDVRSFLSWSAEERRDMSPCPGAVHWRDRAVPERWRPFQIQCRVPVQNVYFRGEP